MLNLCANQNRTSMKTTLLVVGRTVEQHFITAINDYVQRTKRYLSFEMEVIPELKNTKSLSMEVQKEKGRGTDIESSPAGRCGRTAGRRWKRNALHRVCRLYEAQDEYREQTAGIYYRRPLRILPQSVQSGTREDVPLTHDLFPSDGAPHLCGATLPGDDHTERGAVSS